MVASEATKEKLKQAKAKRGATSTDILNRLRDFSAIQKAILEALATEPKTIPQIATDTNLSTQDVFWYVNALRKYNKIHDVKKAGEYFLYAKK